MCSFSFSDIGALFYEWTRAADHIVQIRAGRNHGIHGIFLLDMEIDQRRAGIISRGFQCGADFGARAHRHSLNAEGFCELCEIWADDWRGGVAAVVEKLLPLSDHAEIAV